MRRLTAGALIERGDTAVRHGDSTALVEVATQLARRMGDPLTARLHQFARACIEPGVHTREWKALRQAVRDRIAIAGT